MSESDYYMHQEKISGIAEALSNFARKRMLETFMKVLAPEAATTIVDIGVTCDQRSDSNFFEKLYPHPERITAVGLEDASFLERDFPGLRYVQADALALPFADHEFDIGVSWAVIEHIGNRSRQKQFIEELLRVSRRYFITTPNRWYPIEFHTVLPFLHWLPAQSFRSILKMLKMDFYASEDTLNLLDERALLQMVPPGRKVRKLHFRLFGLISHLIFCVE